MDFIIALIEKYGLVAVFINLFAEGLGLPVPSYPVLMIAAALAPQLHYPLIAVIATGMTAVLLADTLWLWGGHHFGPRIVKTLCRISLSPDSCVQSTNVMYGKIGPFSLAFAKFIPGFSTIGIAIAGSTRAPLLPVIFFDVLGAFIYITTGVALGSIFHDAVADILRSLTSLGEGGLAIVVAAFLSFLAVKWIQRKRFANELRMNRITVSELSELIALGQTPLILDVRPGAIRSREGIIPGSIVAHENELKAIASRFVDQSEVVVYCSCPNEASAVLMARRLQTAGFKKIRPLLGGIEAWTEAGHSVEQISKLAA